MSPKFARVPQEGGLCRGGSRYVEGQGISWFLSFLASRFLGLNVFLVSWFQSFLVAKFLGVLVSKFQ